MLGTMVVPSAFSSLGKGITICAVGEEVELGLVHVAFPIDFGSSPPLSTIGVPHEVVLDRFVVSMMFGD